MRLWLIRHGATAGNADHRYIGATDEPLSVLGERQLRAQAGERWDPKLLFVSPLRRCIQSAKILFPGKEPIVVPEWREIDFGAFEGKNYRELNGDARYQAWIDSGGALPFPDGESREAFCRRCVQGMERVLGCLRKLPADGTAAAVVHGGTIMALGSHYGGGDYFSWQVENGGAICMELTFGQETVITAEKEKERQFS